MEQSRIFFAYAAADADAAQHIGKFWWQDHYAVITAFDAPSVGEMVAWADKQIATCQAFFVLLTRAARESASVIHEIEQALAQRASQPDFLIVPVVLTPSILDAFPALQSFQVIDLTKKSLYDTRGDVFAILSAAGIEPRGASKAPEERERGISSSLPPPAYFYAEPPDESRRAQREEPPPAPDIEPLEPTEHDEGIAYTGSGPALPASPQPYGASPAPSPMQPAPSAPTAAAPVPAESITDVDALLSEPAPPAAAQKAAETALDVAFSAYYPKEVVPRQWERLLVYILLDTPQAADLVRADAAERLVRQRDRFRAAAAQGNSTLRKGSLVTLVPALPGFECNPTSITARWEEDAQCHEFRIRAATVAPGQAVNGAVTVLVSGVIMADIPLSIFVQQEGGRINVLDRFAGQEARRYRKIFASYSHRDSEIVQLCRAATEATGDRFLQDVDLLRSGQPWSDELMRAISEADLFQLFWSRAAAESQHVANEWHYALELLPLRPQFVRPVYWSSAPYRIPTELASLHFERLDLARLGVRRPFWQAFFGRA
jgi:hypothetical protein